MGNHLCKALAMLTDERGRVVFENEGFSASTGFFTDRDGNVLVPHYIQILGGDDLPKNSVVNTTHDGRRPQTNGLAIKPSEILNYTMDPGGTYTIDQEPGVEHTVQHDIPAAPAVPAPSEATMEASAAPEETTSPGGFDRAAAFARLKTLGKPASGNTSNERLEALLHEAEAAVMEGGAGQ